MESSAITTKCVRCESEENIENYLHTTPDLASFRRISRHVTRYTTYKGTGGTGYVPVCSRCIKKFSNWKIYNNINLGLTGVIWLFFSLMLVLLMIAGPTSYIPGLKDIPFEIIITGFGVSLTLVIISVIISFYLNIVSKSNPKNIINIRRRTIRVKPIGGSKWIPIQEWIPERPQDFQTQGSLNLRKMSGLEDHVIESKEREYGEHCENALYDYLESNRGTAYTVKALEKKLKDFIVDPKEREYGKENLENVLNKMRGVGKIHSIKKNEETHYFFP